MARRLRKWWRGLQLALLARQDPASLLQTSQQRLERAYASAVASSPAYRTLVEEAGIDPGSKLTFEQVLAQVPVLEKSDLFERFGLRELLRRELEPQQLANVLTSSGYGGRKFAFGVSTAPQMHRVPADIDLGLQMAFGIDERSSLLINCLPMGVVFASRDVCVANVSVREDMALAILDQAGSLYEQAILCVDPLFCKRLLDYAAGQGFDWSRVRCNLIIGEETFPEDFRSYVASCLQCDLDDATGPMLASSMGVGELGLNLFFETRETIALRRSLHARDPDGFQPAYFHFSPLRTHVEVLAPNAQGVGDLVITVLDKTAAIPMIRYRTGDRASWVTQEELALVPEPLRQSLQAQPLPLIAVHGRSSGEVGDGWHVDHFKALLYRRPELAKHCSGAFRVQRDAAERITLSVQMACDTDAEPSWLQTELNLLVAGVAEQCARSPVAVSCVCYGEFGYGMGLDYERKFRYFESP